MRKLSASARSQMDQPNYHVPALEKGLDILECLAMQGVPLTQTQLARALGRGPSELFRMLACLERRGYLFRDPVSNAYNLTLRLYELAHTHSPYEGLLQAAKRPMRELTEEVRESCHLSVIHRAALLVLSQEESPAKVRLSVEVGGVFSLVSTTSGRLLLAYLTPDIFPETIAGDSEYALLSTAAKAQLHERLNQIRARGYEASSGITEGVSDLAVLVGAPGSTFRAALAISSILRTPETLVRDVLPALRRCAKTIEQSAGFVQPTGPEQPD